MGINTTRGDHGQPIITPTPRTAADLQAISDFAGAGGTRVIAANSTEMTSGFVAKFGFQPYDGLECFLADILDTYTWRSATGAWELAGQPDATVGSGVFTPTSGFTNDGGSQFMTMGTNYCQVYASFRRTGSAIAVPGDGNIAGDIAVGRLSVVPRQSSGLGSGAAGRMAAYLADNTGLVTISSTTPGGSIATGDFLSFAGLYMY